VALDQHAGPGGNGALAEADCRSSAPSFLAVRSSRLRTSAGRMSSHRAALAGVLGPGRRDTFFSSWTSMGGCGGTLALAWLWPPAVRWLAGGAGVGDPRGDRQADERSTQPVPQQRAVLVRPDRGAMDRTSEASSSWCPSGRERPRRAKCSLTSPSRPEPGMPTSAVRRASVAPSVLLVAIFVLRGGSPCAGEDMEGRDGFHAGQLGRPGRLFPPRSGPRVGRSISPEALARREGPAVAAQLRAG